MTDIIILGGFLLSIIINIVYITLFKMEKETSEEMNKDRIDWRNKYLELNCLIIESGYIIIKSKPKIEKVK